MKYQLRGVVVWMVLCVMCLTMTTESMGGAVNRQDPGTASSSRQVTAGSALSKDDQMRRVSDAATKPAERAETTGTGPVPKQEGQVEPQSSRAMTLTTFNVEGNTILTQDKIDAVLAKYKGGAFQFKEIDQARAELEKAYHEAGYPTVLVNLPEQTIEQGSVTLRVIEAPLVEINVTGQEHYSKYRILEKLPSLKIGSVLYEPTLVKELSAVNANPDLKVAPVLKPGSEPGTVDLELKVNDRLPVHGKLEADNRGPITTPRNRLTAEIQHANLFGGDEILTVNTVQTPTDWGAVQNYGASFVYPLKWPDHLLAVYASKSKSTSVLTTSSLSVGAGDVSLAGNATIAGARYIFPIFSGSRSTHQLSVGVDYKRLEKTTATFPGGLGTATVLGGIQYTPASMSYNGLFPDENGLTKLTATAKGYIAGLIQGSSKEDFGGDPANQTDKPGVRAGSTGTFAVLQGGLERTQFLPLDFSLTLHADGQWASQPLIPAEQYFAGGMDTVRGYLNYETAGDHAIRGRAELTTPELLSIPFDRFWPRRKSADYNLRLRLVAFYDAAQLWVAKPQPGQIDQFRLEGTGVGLRGKLPKDVGQFQVDQGWALKETPTTKRGDTFVHFSVSMAF